MHDGCLAIAALDAGSPKVETGTVCVAISIRTAWECWRGHKGQRIEDGLKVTVGA